VRPSHVCFASRVVPILFVVVLTAFATGCSSVSSALRGGASPVTDVDSAWRASAQPQDVPPQGAEPAAADGDHSLVAGEVTDPDVFMRLGASPDAVAAAAQPATAEPVAAEPVADVASDPIAVAAIETTDASPLLLAQAAKSNDGSDDEDIEDYDPWEPFNEKTFEFNRRLDRYVLKPVAKVWDKVLPDEIQRMISRAFDNVGSFKRMINSALQGKWRGAGREVSRFLLNTTFGFGGLWDMAKQEWGIEKSNEDFGQTLGVYGVGAGPYLVVPLLPPMTVRDGIGTAVDSFLNPLGYLIPFIWPGLALKVTDTINDRSLNIELYQGFEETVVDFYSAVRHAYLERRRNLIKE
jgi:phospholipid-binding lipoprotein MlaA